MTTKQVMFVRGNRSIGAMREEKVHVSACSASARESFRVVIIVVLRDCVRGAQLLKQANEVEERK